MDAVKRIGQKIVITVSSLKEIENAKQKWQKEHANYTLEPKHGKKAVEKYQGKFVCNFIIKSK